MPKGPYKLTPAVVQAIVDGLHKGDPIEVACGAAGIHKDTYYDWKKRGEAGEEPYADFREAVENAYATGTQRLLRLIWGATADRRINWQAAAWILERTRTRMFGRSMKVEQDEPSTASATTTPRIIKIVYAGEEPGTPDPGPEQEPGSDKRS